MKKRSSILYSKKAAPWIFILPFLLSFCVFWIYPLGSTIVMSFQKIEPAKTSFVGFENYTKLLKDTAFHTAVGNSFEYMLLTCLILIPLPMLFAVLMDSNLVKAKGFWKAVLYLPALTSVVISGTLFRLMFSEYDTGQLNTTDRGSCSGQILMYTDIRTAGIILRHRYLPTTGSACAGQKH